MNRIHHTQAQKAEKMGVHLEEAGQFIKAIWPMRNMHVFGVDTKWAIEQMQATQRLVQFAEERGSELRVEPSLGSPSQVHLIIDGEPTRIANAPMVWWQQRNDLIPDVSDLHTEPMVVVKVTGPDGEILDDESPVLAAKLVGIEDIVAEELEEEKPKAASVVKQKYRAIYSEAGHPTHCGDELAEKLNNLVHNAGGTSIEYFTMILKANDIDMSKYRTTGNGWQGRYRMTGRNMLAKRVHANGGELKLPSGETLKMSADWMANQRYQK